MMRVCFIRSIQGLSSSGPDKRSSQMKHRGKTARRRASARSLVFSRRCCADWRARWCCRSLRVHWLHRPRELRRLAGKPRFWPNGVPAMRVVPVAEAFQQDTTRDIGAIADEHSTEEQTVARHRRATRRERAGLNLRLRRFVHAGFMFGDARARDRNLRPQCVDQRAFLGVGQVAEVRQCVHARRWSRPTYDRVERDLMIRCGPDSPWAVRPGVEPLPTGSFLLAPSRRRWPTRAMPDHPVTRRPA